MSEITDRYRRVAAGFSSRAKGVPDGAWENPTQCDGWVARDVVRHLVEWLPAYFFTTWEITPVPGPAVDADPVGAWLALDRTIQACLDDPATAQSVRDTRMGPASFEDQIDMICTSDVLIHTWDLARATGQDEQLDPVEVERLLANMLAFDEELLRSSGHYGPRVEVPADASAQDQLIAYVGRRP
jgi:uncharacterized protein (TIGR03086 family)